MEPDVTQNPHTDPLVTLVAWLEEARASGVREPEAMVLATATHDGVPSGRVVLFRGLSPDGALRFFTHYESRKARELDSNPRAALTFHWPSIERQVRVEGTVARLPAAASDAYFAGRARLSQIGAWVSPQSRPIASLDELVVRRADREKEFQGGAVPRPPFWGGYGLTPTRIELWRSGEGRFHDRDLFEREGAPPGEWRVTTLAP
jgi:pyridoxamine 5'-phosphate oxidase